MDQRKRSDAKVNKKRAAAGVKDKPTGAFVPRKTKKTDAMQVCIDALVLKVLGSETVQFGGADVIRMNKLPVCRHGMCVKCAKLG